MWVFTSFSETRYMRCGCSLVLVKRDIYRVWVYLCVSGERVEIFWLQVLRCSLKTTNEFVSRGVGRVCVAVC